MFVLVMYVPQLQKKWYWISIKHVEPKKCKMSFYSYNYDNTIIHFIETIIQNTIGIIIKIQMAWLTGWQVIW